MLAAFRRGRWFVHPFPSLISTIRLPGRWLPAVLVLAVPMIVGLLWAESAWRPSLVLAGEKSCQPVPAAFAGLSNPSPDLSERRVRYWGKQFRSKCARCHGEKGDGGGDEAGRQEVIPANFADRVFMAGCKDGQLFYQIMFGGEERSAMPAFGPDSDQGWSESKVWQMVVFIRRFAP